MAPEFILVLQLIIQTAFSILTFIVLLRFLAQLANADFYNPIIQAIVRFTNPVIRPMQKVIPNSGRFDSASLLLAFILSVIGQWLLIGVTGVVSVSPLLLLLGVVQVLSLLVKMFFYGIIIQVILSWIAPHNHNPAAALIYQITDLLLGPARRLIPPLGGLDFSPVIVLLLLHIFEIIVINQIIQFF
jgi:YggT family protein